MSRLKQKGNIKKFIEFLFNKIIYFKTEFEYRVLINQKYKTLKLNRRMCDEVMLNKHIDYWKQLKRNINPKWFEAYSFMFGREFYNYVPQNIYHNIIEPKLNNRKISFPYKDKNFYEMFYKNKDVFPECIFRNIEGFYYARDYSSIILDDQKLNELLYNYEKIIIKPAIESSGGRNIEVFTKKDRNFVDSKNNILSMQYIEKYYSKNFIVQNWIQQHDYFAQFNPTSLNTVRMHIYRSVVDNEIKVLNTLLRIGGKGSHVDNQSSGGLACHIKEDHTLAEFALAIRVHKFYESNNVKFSKAGKVPKIDEMKKIAKEIGSVNLYSRILGLDFCVDKNNDVKVVEINNQHAGINLQLNFGPFFGKYTDEVVNYCKNN